MKQQFYPEEMGCFPPVSEVVQSDGVAYMRKMLEGKYPCAPISKLLNYQLKEVSKGKVVFLGQPKFDALNPVGKLHGGWYGAALDSAMACAVTTMLGKGFFSTTLEYKVNIMRPIGLGSKVEIIGTVQHVGRSTAVANGDIFGLDDKKLYATASTTCLVMEVEN